MLVFDSKNEEEKAKRFLRLPDKKVGTMSEFGRLVGINNIHRETIILKLVDEGVLEEVPHNSEPWLNKRKLAHEKRFVFHLDQLVNRVERMKLRELKEWTGRRYERVYI